MLFSLSPIHDIMDNRIKGKSFNGPLDDNKAAEDGLGIIPLQHHSGTREINNELKVQKILNQFVKIETDSLKNANIKNSIENGLVGSIQDKTLLNDFVLIMNNSEGVLNCDDGNSLTIDFPENGVCRNTIPDNTCENGFSGSYGGSIACLDQTQEQFDAKFSRLTNLSGHLYIDSTEITNLLAIKDLQMGLYSVICRREGSTIMSSNPKLPADSALCTAKYALYYSSWAPGFAKSNFCE